MRKLLRRKVTWVALALAAALLAGGLWAFQPWKLFTSSHVDEAVPSGFELAPTSAPLAPGSMAASPMTPGSMTPNPMTPGSMAPMTPNAMTPNAMTPSAMAPSPTAPAAPVLLAEGTFVSQEHETTGTARVIAQADGRRLLRFEGLSSSDGPDLHVWLTDAAAGGDWHKYDDGRHVSLGKLTATDGNQNYLIPADVDLAGLRSVVIWCDRFNVAFGSAPLAL